MSAPHTYQYAILLVVVSEASRQKKKSSATGERWQNRMVYYQQLLCPYDTRRFPERTFSIDRTQISQPTGDNNSQLEHHVLSAVCSWLFECNLMRIQVLDQRFEKAIPTTEGKCLQVIYVLWADIIECQYISSTPPNIRMADIRNHIVVQQI